MKSRKALGLASWASVVAALFLFGQSAWIYGKARVAQMLLRRAWTRTVRGGKEVKPWPWADTWPVARLSVPSSRENFIVLAGASGRTLAFGPGHLDGSAQPGDDGNCVLSAHRDTQFEFLRRLDVGDALDLETRDGRRLRYRVFERRVTQKSDTSVLARTAEPTLTLVTCYPFDAIAPGGPLRYVVRAQLMGSRGVRGREAAPRAATGTPSPSSFALSSFGGQVRERGGVRNSNPSCGVRSVPPQELPLSPGEGRGEGKLEPIFLSPPKREGRCEESLRAAESPQPLTLPSPLGGEGHVSSGDVGT